MCSILASALALTRIYTEPECISQQPVNHWWHKIKISCTPSYCTLDFLHLCHRWGNWQFSASHLIQLLILVSPSPKSSASLASLPEKYCKLPSCFLPWTDTVFSILTPLLPALRVAIFRPRKLACVEPADYPQPLGNLCTMLSIPEARSRHTWPAWSHYGLGRIYLLGSNVPQVFSSWRSDTSAERSGTALTGCVASPGCFYFFGMSSLPRFRVCGTEEPSVFAHFPIPGLIALIFSISHLCISHLCGYLALILLGFTFCFWILLLLLPRSQLFSVFICAASVICTKKCECGLLLSKRTECIMLF